jgi:hypothetical protein
MRIIADSSISSTTLQNCATLYELVGLANKRASSLRPFKDLVFTDWFSFYESPDYQS